MNGDSRDRAIPARDQRRKTVQLCGHEYAGARCTRQDGHEGQHACMYRPGAHMVRWD